MSNHIETSAGAPEVPSIAPNRALVAILLIPSLVCVMGATVAFLVFALYGHLWLLWVALAVVVIYMGFDHAVEALARVLS